jgi:hypothetical protein
LTESQAKTPGQIPAQEQLTSSYNLRKCNQDQETETTPVTSPYNLQKHNRDQEDESEENIAKRIKAMLALIELGEYDSDYCETAFVIDGSHQAGNQPTGETLDPDGDHWTRNQARNQPMQRPKVYGSGQKFTVGPGVYGSGEGLRQLMEATGSYWKLQVI